jgi:hypothetical protein
MSRARAAADRVPLDAYQTPGDLALEICDVLRRTISEQPQEIIEPSAGAGAFVAAARATWPDAHITAVELADGRKAACVAAGANVFIRQCWVETAVGLANYQAPEGKPRLVIGNPPFREAERHIAAALNLLRDGDRLVFLLRLNFLGSLDRVRFWRSNRPAWVRTLVPRPSFTGGGTDGTEYAIFCWKKGYRGRTQLLAPLVWKPARSPRHAAWETRSSRPARSGAST